VWLVAAETRAASLESQEKRRRIMVPNTFAVLVVGKN